MNDERTKLLMEALESGATANISKSQDPASAKQNFYVLVDAKTSDTLFDQHGVSEDQISFASRYYKAD